MSSTTGIEWTDATWNPIRGCSRVSEGCRNCYAEKVAYRFSGPGQPYEGLVQLGRLEILTGTRERVPKWNGQIKFVEEHLLDPLKWRTPKRVFVNSMSDLFHENVTDDMLNRIFAVMALAPQHTFQVLTKRPERMLKYLSNDYLYERWLRAADKPRVKYPRLCGIPISDPRRFPLPNVWLGVSVENQKAADERIPLLLQTPAAKRFISAEPLLGPVDLTVIPREPNAFDRMMAGFDRCKAFYLDALAGSNGVLMQDGVSHEEPVGAQPHLDWVICGGESGPGARPMHPDWARGLRDQCVAAGVPFFFKQWGEWVPDGVIEPRVAAHVWVARHGAQHAGYAMTGDERVWRVGKKAAGHVLDGREWHEFPEASR